MKVTFAFVLVSLVCTLIEVTKAPMIVKENFANISS